MSEHEAARWRRRWIWHGLRRYRLYGPSVGTETDPGGGWYQAERFLLCHRTLPGAKWTIDWHLLRMAGDGAQRVRDQELRVQLLGLDAWRREQRRLNRDQRRAGQNRKERSK